jgi:hypothetical protein
MRATISVLQTIGDLGLPADLRSKDLMKSIQRAGSRLRKDLDARWRYNAQPQKGGKRKLGAESASPAPAPAAPPAGVLPEQLLNAEAMALFEAAQAAGGNKLATFRHFVNARQRQQVSGEKREVERLYRRAAALYAGEIKFEPALPFALPAARPPFTRPTPGSLAAIRRAGRLGGCKKIDLRQRGHGLLSQPGGCRERSAAPPPPPLATAIVQPASPLL